eukprot:COSAG01_NODE_10301_length_2198_cov_1.201525_2_plen_58_part_00
MRLACGHVEAALEAAPNLELALRMLQQIREGVLLPSRVDDEENEFSLENLSMVILKK